MASPPGLGLTCYFIPSLVFNFDAIALIISLTLDTYSHIIPTLQKEADEKMEALHNAYAVQVRGKNGGLDPHIWAKMHKAPHVLG
jgi:hypothetical protein